MRGRPALEGPVVTVAADSWDRYKSTAWMQVAYPRCRSGLRAREDVLPVRNERVVDRRIIDPQHSLVVLA